MKRNSLFAVRAILPVVLACLALALVAVAGRVFLAAPDTPTWAAAFKNAEPQRYQNVVVVARSGGDFTSVQEALNSITDNSPTNRYLVWVAPGIYTETATMKSFVDFEGAGELVTKITYMGSASGHPGTVVGASDAELRSRGV
jgi:pectin methylesterase-like acyl-CoA thioesterase